jgi:2-polyprenyl-6-hydroxyphenyl methylase/3-demethylubiquinone-9 3-methyltransferase
MDPTADPPPPRSSVDDAEIARFAAMAEAWWDPDGKFRTLHKFNPPRLAFLRDRLCAHFGRPAGTLRPLDGLAILDVGCGGGLVSEPLARMGARVTGIDAAAENVAVARAHAEATGLAIDYRHATAEDLADAGARFDAVVALEVVEHVADLDAFLGACAAVTRPGGAMVVATLNRTAKAFAFAVVGAEYVLGWLPRGTHQWRKFVRPSELARALRARGLVLAELAGMRYEVLTDEWRLCDDLSVNYLAFATKAGE